MRHGANITLLLLSVVLSCRLPPAGHRSTLVVVGPEGGLLATSWGVALSIPAGALRSVVTVSFGDALDAPPGATRTVAIGPRGTQFQLPVSVFLTAPASATFPGRLKVMTSTGDNWTALSGYATDPSTGEVSGTTTLLSTFGLVESAESCDNGVDDDGDGLADCADPICAGLEACSLTDGGVVPEAGTPDGGVTEDGGSSICHNDHQCPGDLICLNNECVVAPDAGEVVTDAGDRKICHNDHQCPGVEVCIGGACTYPTQDGGN